MFAFLLQLKEYEEASDKELIEQAEYAKEKGTEFFKEGNFEEAVKMYKRIENYVAKRGKQILILIF